MNSESSENNDYIGRHCPPPRDGSWLRVTNFAIDCHFLDAARSASDPETLKNGYLSLDHFFELCALHDDSLPELERPNRRVAEYDREYWPRVHAMLPALCTALDIVRDVLWFSYIVYDPRHRRFSSPTEGALCPSVLRPSFAILEYVFDYPDFKPFRYAYRIISGVPSIYSTSRHEDGGKLAYSFRFKLMDTEVVPEEGRTIDIKRYLTHA